MPSTRRGPADRSRALVAARCRLTGKTQAEAAAEAGCAVRTLRRWESADWWHDLQREAGRALLLHFGGLALGSLERLLLKDDPKTVRWVLERLMPRDYGPVPRREQLPESTATVELEIDVSEMSRQELLEALDAD